MRRLLGALAASLALGLLAASPAGAAFGLNGFDVRFENEDGSPATRAGSHPFQVSTVFHLNTKVEAPSKVRPDEELKDLRIRLPIGFAGNPTALPRCSDAVFLKLNPETEYPACPDATVIGAAVVKILQAGTSEGTAAPVFNLKPGPGTAAKFGFLILREPVTIEVGVKQSPPYNVVPAVVNATQVAEFFGSKVTIWGNPADSRHDPLRGPCLDFNASFESFASRGNCPVGPGVEEKPFLTLPRACAPPLFSTFAAVSWQSPLAPPVTGASKTALGLSECSQLEFDPTIKARPTSAAAESPSGLDFDLDVEDPGLTDPDGTAEADIKKAVVTLPEGITTNPAVAAGLSACTLAQYDSERADADSATGCPESSKVGSVEVETPLLEAEGGGLDVLHGSIYVAKQGDNPFGNLLTIYMVISDPGRGILIKAAGKVEPDPVTGQLRTTFDDLPQLPFSHFHLHFREGQRAPLITPATCGTYTTTAELYPYSAPDTPRLESASFTVGAGAGGGPCAESPSQLPSQASFSAGTVNPTSGAGSPFLFRVSREDGTQHLASISATLPDGLTGRLAGIPYCPEAGIAQAKSRSGEGQGALELSQPSCPLASQLGTVTVGAGAGSQPYHVQGKAYLAGPYKGAPLSMAIVTPAIAGPFDLGVVAVRTALRVDSETARITAVSDPIPQILHGLPLVVRSVALDLDRPSFMLNPTGCEPKSIDALAIPTLGQAATLSQYFQASDCARLKYKPKLTLRLKGGSKRSDNPALRATASFPQGAFANTARVQVALPHSEFLDQSHIRTICTRVQFAADACPKGSVYGKARAVTPLLDEPLSGPVYLRSNGGERELPDLVAALDGQIDFDLVGHIDSVRGRIRTTFAAAPDVPVESFTLSMQGGKKGLLENSTDICRRKNRADASFTAHNGLRFNARPVLRAECGSDKHRR